MSFLLLLVFLPVVFPSFVFENLSVSLQAEISDQFRSFRALYQPLYETKQEEAYRFSVFAVNYLELKELEKKTTDVVGVSKFTDRTKLEFEKMMGYIKHVDVKKTFRVDYKSGEMMSEQFLAAAKTRLQERNSKRKSVSLRSGIISIKSPIKSSNATPTLVLGETWTIAFDYSNAPSGSHSINVDWVPYGSTNSLTLFYFPSIPGGILISPSNDFLSTTSKFRGTSTGYGSIRVSDELGHADEVFVLLYLIPPVGPLVSSIPSWPSSKPLNWCSTNNPYGKSMCTGIKDQGTCGACWAFSGETTAEMSYAINNGGLNPILMAVEQVATCATDAYSTHVCGGGDPNAALFYALKTGLQPKSDYSDAWNTLAFTGNNPKPPACDKNAANLARYHFHGWCNYYTLDHNTAAQYLLMHGPSTVAVDASSWGSIPFGQNTILSDSSTCRPGASNHAVTLVGWDHDSISGNDYWILRNQWTDTWANSGYIYVKKDAQNVCGVMDAPMWAAPCRVPNLTSPPTSTSSTNKIATTPISSTKTITSSTTSTKAATSSSTTSTKVATSSSTTSTKLVTSSSTTSTKVATSSSTTSTKIATTTFTKSVSTSTSTKFPMTSTTTSNFPVTSTTTSTKVATTTTSAKHLNSSTSTSSISSTTTTFSPSISPGSSTATTKITKSPTTTTEVTFVTTAPIYFEFLAPVGNPTFQIGDLLSIRWNMSGISANFMIDLLCENSNLTNIATSVSPDVSYFLWRIPTSLPISSFPMLSIRFTFDSASKIAPVTSTLFSIVFVIPTIVISSPTLGSVYENGSVVPIVWSSRPQNLSSDTGIRFFLNNSFSNSGKQLKILNISVSSGFAEIIIPNSLIYGVYFIEFHDTQNRLTGRSPYFSVSSSVKATPVPVLGDSSSPWAKVLAVSVDFTLNYDYALYLVDKISNDILFQNDVAKMVLTDISQIVISAVSSGSTVIKTIIPCTCLKCISFNYRETVSAIDQKSICDLISNSIKLSLNNFNSPFYGGAISRYVLTSIVNPASEVIVCSDGQVYSQSICPKTSFHSSSNSFIYVIIAATVGLIIISSVAFYCYRRHLKSRAMLELPAISTTPKVLFETSNSLYNVPSSYPVLPTGWSQHADDSGNIYYYNEQSGVSTWIKPT